MRKSAPYIIAILLVAVAVLAYRCLTASRPEPYDKSTHSPFILSVTDTLASKNLGETRVLNVYLPEGYTAGGKETYPVIYLLDGGVEEDFVHITGIVRYNTQPWINRFPKSIVVGIENTNRMRDFTYAVPNLDFAGKMGFKKEDFKAYGGSARFISFIENELQPFIENNYRTNASRTIIGESLGGLLSTEILLKHRNLFNTYIIMSPSLWWGNESLLAEAPGLLKSQTADSIKVYIGAANREENIVMYDDAVALSEILKQNAGGKIKVFYDYLPDELHSTMIHQAVYNAFKQLYPHTEYQK